jgi:hypothetical protein
LQTPETGHSNSGFALRRVHFSLPSLTITGRGCTRKTGRAPPLNPSAAGLQYALTVFAMDYNRSHK